MNDDSLISIIIPTLNEADNIRSTIESVQAKGRVEIIVVDGGSVDNTRELAGKEGARVIYADRGRSRQMNAGAGVAQGEILFFLHGDTRAPRGFAKLIREALQQPGVAGGAFRLKITGSSKDIKIIEGMANLRSKFFQLPYGDQGLFLRTELFRRLGGFPDLPIMEDFVFIRRLRRQGKIFMAPVPVLTSGRRWLSLGIWRTTWINQLMVAGYYLGIAPDILARWYRRR